MTETRSDQQWVDLYVAGRLTDDEQEAFELRLMESADLQAEVEAALALKTGLTLQRAEGETSEPMPRRIRPVTAFAAAAAVGALALVLALLVNRPDWPEETFRLDIVRSGGPTPEWIYRLPDEPTWITLDIELDSRFDESGALQVTVTPEAGGDGLRASAKPANRRVQPRFRGTALPTDRVYIEISDPARPEVIPDRRLIEFVD